MAVEGEDERYKRKLHRLQVFRGYVFIAVGLLLLLYAVIAGNAASFTLGGAVIGFDPVLRSVNGAKSNASQ